MRGKILFSAALAAVVGLFAFAPNAAQARGDMVSVRESYLPGTIVIQTNERALYYFVGVGPGDPLPGRRRPPRHAMEPAPPSSTANTSGRPGQPPESIRKDYSRLPPVVPGGSPQNPMGVAAMTLSGGGQYAIHGTNNEGSIGGFVSHGCIRMHNADITDLYSASASARAWW